MELIKLLVKWVIFQLRFLTSIVRKNPDLLIIGVQKSATSSVYSMLTQHPLIGKSFKKEVHYFDLNFSKSKLWYKSHFGFAFSKKTFIDATPYYIFAPNAIENIHKYFGSSVKIVIIFREPTSRLLSQYKMEVRNGYEKNSLERAIEIEINSYNNIYQGASKHVKNDMLFHQHHCCLNRSLYLNQMIEVLKYFHKSRICVLHYEDIINDTNREVNKIIKFLKLSEFEFLVEHKNISGVRNIDNNYKLENKVMELLKSDYNNLLKLLKRK